MVKNKKTALMILGSFGSLGTTLFLLILKAIAFISTGSVAILSSLFDSVQDLMSSFINMIAVYQAVQPADKMHRFGHGKAQGIGGLLQAFIIVVSSILLVIESVQHLMRPVPVQQVNLGIVIILISILLTACLVGFQNHVIRQTGAVSIKADRLHYAGDTVMNIGVLLSLLATKFLGWLWIDGVFGIFVAMYLLYTVWHIMKETCALLMDRELSKQIRHDITQMVLKMPQVKAISNLRTREGGNQQFAQFNVQFDKKESLQRAHEVLDRIEAQIKQKYPDMDVIIHAEPFLKKK